jgi:porin
MNKIKIFSLLFFFYLYSLSLFASSPIIYDDVWSTGYVGFECFGLRPKLADRGIYFLTTFTWDYNWPAKGGIQTRSFPLHQYLYDLQLGLETEKLLCWPGGRFLINFQYHQTQAPSLKYVGDWQGFDNMEAPNITHIGELWFQQKLFDDKLVFYFGKIDAYTIFNYSSYAQYLLNNSFTQIPTLIAFPTYPNQAVGGILEYYPLKWFSLRTSIFDASLALGVQTGALGARRFFVNLGQHANLLNELEWTWGALEDRYAGTFKLGFWGLTATLPNFDGGSVRGTTGSYFCFNQSLWKEDYFSKKRDREHLRELGLFLQWGTCGKEVFPVKSYFGYGATFHNITSSLEDTFSLGAATVLFTNAKGASYPKHFEMAIDATYQFYVLNYFMVQPDFQYIIHPGGQGLRNAIVATLRLMASI